MSPQPITVVFFAGAFADPSCFDVISADFRNLGYSTVYASVPSLNSSDPTSVSTVQDAEATRKNVLLPLLEEGRDVVIFAHSYGGVVAGAAAAGLSKTARSANNEAGGVVGLIYLAGNIVKESESLLESIGGAYPPFIKEHHPSQGLCVIDPVMPTLYNDADDSMAPQLEAAMIPHALAAFETPAGAPAWAEPGFEGRRVYIRTLDDQCNPLFVQDMWIEKTGVKWDIVDMKTSHCPFISCPQELVGIVKNAVEKW